MTQWKKIDIKKSHFSFFTVISKSILAQSFKLIQIDISAKLKINFCNKIQITQKLILAQKFKLLKSVILAQKFKLFQNSFRG